MEDIVTQPLTTQGTMLFRVSACAVLQLNLHITPISRTIMKDGKSFKD